jgi:hypothetical protein
MVRMIHSGGGNAANQVRMKTHSRMSRSTSVSTADG